MKIFTTLGSSLRIWNHECEILYTSLKEASARKESWPLSFITFVINSPLMSDCFLCPKIMKEKGGGAREWKENPHFTCFPTIPSSQLSCLVLSLGPKVNDVRSEAAPDSALLSIHFPNLFLQQIVNKQPHAIYSLGRMDPNCFLVFE